MLRLIQQLDELSNAIQSAIHGSLSISLINPTVLLNILKNIPLQLPSGYELIAGDRAENIHLYYELVKVSIAANLHSIKLIISVPLKSTDRHFTLYKVVTLPEQISSNRFVRYLIDYPYFGIHNNQLDYLLFTEEQYSHCTSGSIVICPIHTAIYNARTLSYASSLYFQNSNNYRLCKRELLLHQQTPLLQKHGAYWVYYFPEKRSVTIHCSEPTRQLTRTVSLHGPGLLHNVTSCHISSSELRSLPQLRGSTQTELDSPNFYLPSGIPTVTTKLSG